MCTSCRTKFAYSLRSSTVAGGQWPTPKSHFNNDGDRDENIWMWMMTQIWKNFDWKIVRYVRNIVHLIQLKIWINRNWKGSLPSADVIQFRHKTNTFDVLGVAGTCTERIIHSCNTKQEYVLCVGVMQVWCVHRLNGASVLSTLSEFIQNIVIVFQFNGEDWSAEDQKRTNPPFLFHLSSLSSYKLPFTDRTNSIYFSFLHRSSDGQMVCTIFIGNVRSDMDNCSSGSGSGCGCDNRDSDMWRMWHATVHKYSNGPTAYWQPLFDNATCGRPSSNTCISRFRQMPNAWCSLRRFIFILWQRWRFGPMWQRTRVLASRFQSGVLWSRCAKGDGEQQTRTTTKNEKKRIFFGKFFRWIEICCCQTRNIIEHFPPSETSEWVKSQLVESAFSVVCAPVCTVRGCVSVWNSFCTNLCRLNAPTTRRLAICLH